MDLSTSPGALLHNLSKVLLDGSMALQAAQKRDYNKFVDMSIHSYPVTCVYTAREH